MDGFYTHTPDGLILAVRVLPGARRCGVQGLWNNTHLKIALPAPAVDGKANEALIQFLKNALSVRTADIEIVSGHKGRTKIIRIKASISDSIILDLLK